jgi:hypothetical protein
VLSHSSNLLARIDKATAATDLPSKKPITVRVSAPTTTMWIANGNGQLGGLTAARLLVLIDLQRYRECRLVALPEFFAQRLPPRGSRPKRSMSFQSIPKLSRGQFLDL